MYSTTKRDEST